MEGTFVIDVVEASDEVSDVLDASDEIDDSTAGVDDDDEDACPEVLVYGPGVEHGLLYSFVSVFVCDIREVGVGEQLVIRVDGPGGRHFKSKTNAVASNTSVAETACIKSLLTLPLSTCSRCRKKHW